MAAKKLQRNEINNPKGVIKRALMKVAGEKVVELEVPTDPAHGDYASNIAMAMFSSLQIPNPKSQINSKFKKMNFGTPADLARAIKEELIELTELNRVVGKVEVTGLGFIDFWLSEKYLRHNLGAIVQKKSSYGRSEILKNKKILLEHTSPNTVKTLHVGHARNNVLGMAIHNILEFAGARVTMDAINNDRGIHVMKAVWAYQKFGRGKTPESEKTKPDHFVDKFYTLGVRHEEDEGVRDETRELLRKWEAGDKEVRIVWKKLRDWTLEGFAQTYRRLGSRHDHEWYESNFYEEGREIAREGLARGVFKKLEDGAILSDLARYGLTDSVILRADGTTMYHTQDLRLTQLKREHFPSDLYIWDIGPEQTLYLKQLFAMLEALGIGERGDYLHLPYGFVYLKGHGKMSSRAGNVVSADELMDEMIKKASAFTGGSPKLDVAVGIGALKYALLKLARTTSLHFDIDESLSLEGNSGPYLQYTAARANSVLLKAKFSSTNFQSASRRTKFKINNEEALLLRHFVHFQEAVEDAAVSYAPNLVANYLYELARRFNTFYAKHRIINHQSSIINHQRLALTVATGQILKTGLGLLGIQAPERM